MDTGTNVQDENLVNDQVAQALTDSGLDGAAPAPETVIPAPIADPTPEAIPAPTAEEAVVAEAQPTESPVEDEGPALLTDEEPSTPAESPVISPISTSASTGNADDDELMSVKQKALEQLSPLVDHLDLPPDQKFDTYMEILRASDDKSLVQPAFDAAQEIEDEDKRAQALLDVVNEVNYLTQDHKASE